MELISGKVYYISIKNRYIIYNIDILQKNIIKFKNEDIYINHMINYIKDNIIKNCFNLKNIKIKIEIFDKNNYIHNIIINVINKLHNNQLNNQYNRLILIYIFENNNIMFIGNLNF